MIIANKNWISLRTHLLSWENASMQFAISARLIWLRTCRSMMNSLICHVLSRNVWYSRRLMHLTMLRLLKSANRFSFFKLNKKMIWSKNKKLKYNSFWKVKNIFQNSVSYIMRKRLNIFVKKKIFLLVLHALLSIETTFICKNLLASTRSLSILLSL